MNLFSCSLCCEIGLSKNEIRYSEIFAFKWNIFPSSMKKKEKKRIRTNDYTCSSKFLDYLYELCNFLLVLNTNVITCISLKESLLPCWFILFSAFGTFCVRYLLHKKQINRSINSRHNSKLSITHVTTP